MGVNRRRRFVRFVRFFLMNKSYTFCALAVIIRYNNHTPTPPKASRAEGLVTSVSGFYDFFWIFLFFRKSALFLDLFSNILVVFDFLTF